MFTRSVIFPAICVIAALCHLVSAGSYSGESQPDYVTRNLNTVRSIYNLTVYPKNFPIIAQGASAVPPGLFSENPVGRVVPVGNFSGFTDSIEYFFALAPTPETNPGKIGFYKAEVVEFTSGCPEVASSVVYLRTAVFDNATGQFDLSQPTTTLTQVAFFRFDENGAVVNYHAWIPTLQAWTEVGNKVDFDNIVIQKAVPLQLCPQIQQNCKDKDQQYSSVAECVADLELKPFGTFDEAWGDNIVCRQIHVLLTKVRPDIHCPHVGPKGGSPPDNWKCVDIDYSDDYYDDAELFGSPLGSTFSCGGPLL